MRHREVDRITRDAVTLLVIKSDRVTTLQRATRRPTVRAFRVRRHLGDHEKSISLHKALRPTSMHDKKEMLGFLVDFSWNSVPLCKKPSHNIIRMKPASINKNQLRMFVYSIL